MQRKRAVRFSNNEEGKRNAKDKEQLEAWDELWLAATCPWAIGCLQCLVPRWRDGTILIRMNQDVNATNHLPLLVCQAAWWLCP